MNVAKQIHGPQPLQKVTSTMTSTVLKIGSSVNSVNVNSKPLDRDKIIGFSSFTLEIGVSRRLSMRETLSSNESTLQFLCKS